MKQYWRFYWPLALTGLAMVLSVQFQNATLARYPEAVAEIAILALAYSTYGLLNAGLQFIAQLSNVYARSPIANIRSYRFTLAASTILMMPLLAVAHTELGRQLLQSVYGIDDALTARVTEYLVYLAPLIVFNAQRFYYTGLLVQAKLTGWVTAMNVVYLSVVIAALIGGFAVGGRPVVVLVGAEALGVAIHLVLLVAGRWKLYRPPVIPEHENLSYRELIGFFIPVSMTGFMFAISRPILFAFVARTPNALVSIAALRIAFDFSALFQQASNQFRHFFVTFGLDDLAVKKRFMVLVCLGITGVMLLFAATPLSGLVWRDLMQIPDEVRILALDVILIMCLMPTVIIYRNFFHGCLMVERRTTGMAVGAVLRVIGIYALTSLCFELQWLDHIAASWILIAGFLIEAAVAQLAVRKARPNG